MTKHRPVDQRKDQILSAALKIFTRKGVAQTSMSDIVAESGLSKGGVYWHFKSKSDIIAGALERFMNRDLTEVAKIVAMSELDARERLKLAAAEIGKGIEQMRGDLPLLIEVYGLAGRHPEIKAPLQKFYAEYQDLISQILDDGIERSEFMILDSQYVAWQLIAHAEGHFVLWMLNPQAALQEQLISTVDIFVDGLAA